MKSKVFLIVGLGLMGGTYAKILSQNNFCVLGHDIDDKIIKMAENKGYIVKSNLTLKEKFSIADMIIFATYPDSIIEYIIKYQDHFKSGAIVTDISGIKVELLDGIKKVLKDNIKYISHHPMAGREKKGIMFVDDTMFEKANFIITPFTNDEDISEIISLGKILGFKNIETLSPSEHDRIIGFLSQLTHVIAISLMNMHDCNHLIKYTGDSFRDLTRIASINSSLWSKLFLGNKKILINEINMFISSLEEVKLSLEENDENKLISLMEQASSRREKFNK